MLKNNRGIREVNGKKYYSPQAITREFMNKDNSKFAHDFADLMTLLKIYNKEYIVKKSNDMWKEDKHIYVYTLNDDFAKFIPGQYLQYSNGCYLDEDAVEILITIYERFKEEKLYVSEYEDFVIRNISLVKVRQENRA